jgi:phage-related protein
VGFSVKFFTTLRGDSPVKTFLDSLDSSTQAKAIRTIELLEQHGSTLPAPYAKKLTNGIYELRTSGKIPIRIFYTNHLGVYYLLSAFKKKSQKTPLEELQTAIDRKRRLI